MGPHSFKCGKTSISDMLNMVTRASMGPHSFKCGKTLFAKLMFGITYRFNGAALFQVRKISLK